MNFGVLIRKEKREREREVCYCLKVMKTMTE